MRGAGGNADLWAPDIIHLAKGFWVYAIDVIGESGKSAPTRPSYKGVDYGDWLLDIFDALKIERASVIGTSRGGWLTLKIALYAPERVNRIIPISTEGIAPVSASFFMHMLPLLLMPNRKSIESLLRFLTPPNLTVNEHNRPEHLRG
jgi:pimeloyl-ACP methyl ester carboxylesterase